MSAESPHSSSDPASETEVATLLEATVAATQFPAPGSAATAHAGTEQPGTWIGRYQLIDKLGEGGFGTVWRAGQREPIHREVALKLVKPGMASGEIIARFAAERQALAMMDHPNIAAVLDAGETESGRPFFVMELVKGQSLAAWCDGKQLSVRQRIAYFIQVCPAIQHAHQKGIPRAGRQPS